MAIFSISDKIPSIAPTAYVDETATVTADVTLEDNVSVWPGASIRGDEADIVVRAGSNIQDNAVLHTDPGKPCRVGQDVTVGHGAILHGCTIGDESLIGMGAVILNSTVIGRQTLVGAGTLIAENKTFPDGVLILGRPGRIVRELTAEEKLKIRDNAREYIEQKNRYQTEKKRIG